MLFIVFQAVQAIELILIKQDYITFEAANSGSGEPVNL